MFDIKHEALAEGVYSGMQNLKTKVTYKKVIEQIRDHISDLQLQPGDRLPTEHQLAETMGVSRGTVREALKSFEILGIVETKRGSGMFVRSFSFEHLLQNLPYNLVFNYKELSDLLAVRKSLECSFIRQVAETIEASHLAAVEEALASLHETVKAEDPAAYSARDLVFHTILYQGLGNGMLLQLVDTFFRYLESGRDRSSRLARSVELLPGSYERHCKIVEALRSHNGDLAAEQMGEHFIFSEQRIHAPLEPH